MLCALTIGSFSLGFVGFGFMRASTKLWAWLPSMDGAEIFPCFL